LDIFLYDKSTLNDFVPGQHSADLLNIVPTKGRKVNECGVVQLTKIWMTGEGSVHMLVVVTILFEDIPQEHQLSLQAVFITNNSGPVHQSRKCSSFIGWVKVGLGVEVAIGVFGLVIHFVAQRAIRSLVNIYIQEER
jgi:hypothetical protein